MFTITMIDKIIDIVGDWNAQLFRELKGRLTLRNLIWVGGGSLGFQFLLFTALSDSKCIKYENNHSLGYCVEYVWEIKWLLIFQFLYWMLSLILFCGVVYLLVRDLTQEQRGGTLNFIRLSPQSSHKIFIGKLLGVPILVYLTILLAVPLHLISAIAAGIPLGWLVSLYAIVLVGAIFLFSLAMLTILFSSAEHQESALAIVSFCLGSSYLAIIFTRFSWSSLTYYGWESWQWFALPIGNHLGLMTLWTLMTVGTVAYWIWQSLNRRFNHPHCTLISKKQSYWIVGSFQVWLLGLLWPFMSVIKDDKSLLFTLLPISIINLGFLLIIAAIICPQRPTLIDWSRYRNQNQNFWQGTSAGEKQNLWADLILGEKSPAPAAIALNIGISSLILIPFWILVNSSISNSMQAIAAWVMSVNLILIYALIIQLGLLMKSQQRAGLTLIELTSAIFLPILILLAVENKSPVLWMFSVFGIAWAAVPEAPAIAIGFVILGQWLVIAGLSFGLTKKLHHLGASDSQKLLTSV
ncbi:hypothetical protein [Planktothricoides raciborskii]|uniref:ABC transporter permease n=1 Tax=Planktothricoides raciborskii GIHE-MW2 TaxID=2792601 RepID=A0AAU8JFC2_9CYAN